MSAKRCANCGTSHAPPRGKRCTRPDTTPEPDALGERLASTLDNISQRLERLELASQQSHAPASSTSPTAQARSRLLDLSPSTTDFEDSDDSDEESQKLKEKRKSKKSGKLRTAEHKIRYEVDWPHFYVYRKNVPATYDSVSVPEFTFGYMCAMENADRTTAHHMKTHLKVLMEEASQYKWDTVRSYHAVVLNNIETGRLAWPQASCEDLRRRHIWNSNTPSDQKQTSEPRKSCPSYQDGTCAKERHHDGLLHACRYCLKTVRRPYRHPENQCARKLAEAKNREVQAVILE
jgi:hypothetical protein